jgi:HSP20 family protein
MAIKDLIPWRRRESKVPVRREEEEPLDLFQQDMNRLFDEFFQGFGLAPFPATGEMWDAFTPRVDVVESDDELKVSAELPGIDEKDIDVSLSRDVLTISGEKKEKQEYRGEYYFRTERSYGSFQRSIPLPCNVDTGKVEAIFDNGVLTITLPKTDETRCRKRIEVRTR